MTTTVTNTQTNQRDADNTRLLVLRQLQSSARWAQQHASSQGQTALATAWGAELTSINSQITALGAAP
ncbi:MAG: hypothetical protein O9284_09395 [Steroidobacteraceae bacterium]|jgi:hypothetical protein|nr:hypothetical protein [Steroidobacteraceae bacterium]